MVHIVWRVAPLEGRPSRTTEPWASRYSSDLLSLHDLHASCILFQGNHGPGENALPNAEEGDPKVVTCVTQIWNMEYEQRKTIN